MRPKKDKYATKTLSDITSERNNLRSLKFTGNRIFTTQTIPMTSNAAYGGMSEVTVPVSVSCFNLIENIVILFR